MGVSYPFFSAKIIIMKGNNISNFTKICLFFGAVALIVSLFVPLWRIDLDAPQYPEGLRLLIYPDEIGGDVEIINGLNHYIGMDTLHTEDFLEFTLLPYLIIFYALLIFSVIYIKKKKWLNVVFVSFLLFGIVAMVDFWRWEYNYGHNLDPNAAIIVPGMAYQPPLIGFKQLLNFGAYSIPDIGGWLFVSCGVILLFTVIYESKFYSQKFNKANSIVLLFFFFFLAAGCGPKGPVPIMLNKDACSYCIMPISDLRFGAEAITTKGRVYKFDDIHCLINYQNENTEVQFEAIWVCDFNSPNDFLKVDSAFFLKSEKFNSPMGGNTPAFHSLEKLREIANNDTAMPLKWNKLK